MERNAAVVDETTRQAAGQIGQLRSDPLMASAVGYTGSVGIQLYKDLGHPDLDYYQFLRLFTYAMAVAGTVLFLLSSVYFYRKSVACISQQPEGAEA